MTQCPSFTLLDRLLMCSGRSRSRYRESLFQYKQQTPSHPCISRTLISVFPSVPDRITFLCRFSLWGINLCSKGNFKFHHVGVKVLVISSIHSLPDLPVEGPSQVFFRGSLRFEKEVIEVPVNPCLYTQDPKYFRTWCLGFKISVLVSVF